MIGKLIYGRLSSASNITAIISTNIYPDITPQNVDYPFIVYSIIDSNPVDYKDGQSNLEEIDLQIDVYTQNYDTTQNLSNLIRNRLDRFVGTVEGVEVQSIKYVRQSSQVFNAELSVYWVSIDFMIKMKR
jgi:hypothetical protein